MMNVTFADAPWLSCPLSNDAGPLTEVKVCAAPSLLVTVSLAPTDSVVAEGEKAKSLMVTAADAGAGAEVGLLVGVGFGVGLGVGLGAGLLAGVGVFDGTAGDEDFAGFAGTDRADSETAAEGGFGAATVAEIEGDVESETGAAGVAEAVSAAGAAPPYLAAGAAARTDVDDPAVEDPLLLSEQPAIARSSNTAAAPRRAIGLVMAAAIL